MMDYNFKEYEEQVLNYVSSCQISAFPNYAATIDGHNRMEKAMAIFRSSSWYLSTEALIHLAGLTDLVVCAILNPSLYPIYNYSVAEERLTEKLNRLKNLWWSYFVNVVKDSNDVETARISLKLISRWNSMLSLTKSHNLFLLLLQDGEFAIQRAIQKTQEKQDQTQQKRKVVQEKTTNKLPKDVTEECSTNENNIPVTEKICVNVPLVVKSPTLLSPENWKKKQNNKITNYFNKPVPKRQADVSKRESSQQSENIPPIAEHLIHSGTKKNTSPNDRSSSCNMNDTTQLDKAQYPDVIVVSDFDYFSDSSMKRKLEDEENRPTKKPVLKNAFSLLMSRSKPPTAR